MRPEMKTGKILCALGLLIAATTTAHAKNSFALLAVSWQPAFCEQRFDRPECASQTQTRYDASHFSLHGLWPGPRSRTYCNISKEFVAIDKKGRWGKLPDLRLDPSLLSKLSQVMPGTRSFLQRHEWIKHGSCHEKGSTNGYFRDSLRLMNELNSSAVQQLFAANIGKFLRSDKIQSAFDETFGAGAGDRIKIKCSRDGNRQLIREITIGLYGKFEEDVSMKQLIQNARPTATGCKGGIVDRAGLQ